jgi:hypothetical protein
MKKILILTLLFFCFEMKAQVYVGSHLFDNYYGEIGYYRFYDKSDREYLRRKGEFPLAGFVYSMGSEFTIRKDFIVAPKISASAYSLFIGTKIDLLYYMSNNGNTLAIRPQIGLPFLMYGYNIPFNNSLGNRINRHCFSFYLPIKPKQQKKK